MFLSRRLLVEADFRLDVEVFLSHTRVRHRQLSQLGQTLQGFFIAFLGCQPARREWQYDHTSDQDKARDHLEEKR